MGSQLQTGRTSVTGNVTAVPSKLSVTLLAGTTSGASDVTLGTVPVGKVWRVIHAWCSIGEDGAASVGVGILLNGTLVVGAQLTSNTGGACNETAVVSFDYGCCPVLTAGQTAVLDLTGTGISGARGGISYVEENA